MKTSLPLIFPFLMFCARAAEPTVKLVGIQAVFDDCARDFDGLMTYRSENGLGITLIVRTKEKAIMAFDEDKTSLKIGGIPAKCHFPGDYKAFSKDHYTLRLEFSTPEFPKPSPDGTFKVQGELSIALATGTEETRSEQFEVATGVKVKFPGEKPGMPTFKVKSYGKPTATWSEDRFMIEFTTNRKFEEFAGIDFYTGDGKRVEARVGGRGWTSSGGGVSSTFEYTFEAPLLDPILGVKTWIGKEEKKLKVDLNAGLVESK